MPYIIDACAILAFIGDEEGADKIEEALTKEAGECYIHALNMSEVYYNLIRDVGQKDAENALSDLKATGIKIREDMDEWFWARVGLIKSYGRISLGDCCAIALAIRENVPVLTSDHVEFEPIRKKKICSVEYFRSQTVKKKSK